MPVQCVDWSSKRSSQRTDCLSKSTIYVKLQHECLIGPEEAILLFALTLKVQEEKLGNDPFDEWPTLHFEEVEVSEEECSDEEADGDESE